MLTYIDWRNLIGYQYVEKCSAVCHLVIKEKLRRDQVTPTYWAVQFYCIKSLANNYIEQLNNEHVLKRNFKLESAVL